MQSGRLEDEELQVIPRRRASRSEPSVTGLTATSGSADDTVKRASHFPGRRRALRKVVLGAVGVCGAILVLAAVGKARSTSDSAAAATSTSTSTSTSTPTPTSTSTSTPAPPSPPTTGTLRFQRPAVPGSVWIDGTRVLAPTAVITCGKHQVKIGARGKAHSVDVPCGGELRIAR